MGEENSLFYNADGTLKADQPGGLPDAETLARINKRLAAWRRWNAGEDVSDDELFGEVEVNEAEIAAAQAEVLRAH